MSEHISFAQFDAILRDLGFEKAVVPGSSVVYYHKPTDTTMPVRLMRPDELIPDYLLAAARSQLDGRGIIEATAFDRMIRIPAA
jgi:hypothetical protein